MSAASAAVAIPRRVDRWIFQPGSARRLAAVRIGMCVLLAGRLSRPFYLQLAGQPRVLFRPISFMHLFPSLPPRGVVLTIEIVAFVAALLGATGLFARAALPVAWLGALFLDGMWTSVGQPMHNETLLTLGMFPLLFARTADAWSVPAWWKRRPRHERSVAYGWPLRAAMIVIAGGYFFSGFYKLIFSGPAWALGDNLRWVMYGISDQNARPIGPAIFLAAHPLLTHIVAVAALLTELAFPLVLWKPRAGWILVPAVVLMHLGIGLTMHLDYSVWALTAVIVFVPWDDVADRRSLRGRVSRRRATGRPVAASAGARR
jgi:hypothetical protein